MRIIAVYGQNLIFNLDDRVSSTSPSCVTDLNSMYTENGFMLPLGYSDILADIYSGGRGDALRDNTVIVLGLQLTHNGMLYSFGKARIKPNIESRNDLGIEYRRILHGPDTRRFWDTRNDKGAEALKFILDQCPDDPERALDVFCSVVNLVRKSFIILSFTEIQAKLVEKGFTKPLKINDAIERASESDIMGDFTPYAG